MFPCSQCSTFVRQRDLEHHQQQEVSALVYAAVSSFVSATISIVTASAISTPLLHPTSSAWRPRPFYAIHHFRALMFNILS
jgi:hypothetical protein